MQISSSLPTPCVLRLQSIYGSLKRAERNAADLLRTDPAFVQQASIADAADRAGCSQPTFLRLARRLGFSGFAELKAALKTGVVAVSNNMSSNVHHSITMLNKTIERAGEQLRDNWSVIDHAQFQSAVEASSAARSLYFFGLGEAAMIARLAAYHFMMMGFQSRSSSDIDEQQVMLTQMDGNDVCIVFSDEGDQRAEVTVARSAQKHGVRVIAVTSFPYSPLGKASDILLATVPKHSTDQDFSLCISFSQLLLVEGLAQAVAHENELCKLARKHSESAQRLNRIAQRGG